MKSYGNMTHKIYRQGEMILGKNILTAIMLGLTWALTLVGVAEARHEYIGNRHTAVMTERGVAREQRGGNIQERVAAIISDATEDTGQYSLLNSSVMRMLEVTATDGGGTLLFSDSPEYVKDNGILYQDTVSGNARILYYHLNDTLQPKKLAVVIEAVAGDAFVTVTRGGTSRPSHDYLKVGKATQLAYFNSEDRQEKILVTPEAPRLLQADMDKTVLHAGELVYGVYDFQATAPVKVSVIMYGANRNPFRFLKEATVLPRDEVALRGTFHGMNRIITAKKPYNPDRLTARITPA